MFASPAVSCRAMAPLRSRSMARMRRAVREYADVSGSVMVVCPSTTWPCARRWAGKTTAAAIRAAGARRRRNIGRCMRGCRRGNGLQGTAFVNEGRSGRECHRLAERAHFLAQLARGGEDVVAGGVRLVRGLVRVAEAGVAVEAYALGDHRADLLGVVDATEIGLVH